MKPEQFAEIVNNRLEQVRITEQIKGAEYSRGDDRFHNFKRAAAMDGTTPVRSMWGMWKKHLVSIIDMVDDLDQGIIPTPRMIKEKCGDNIVYSLLFEGLVEEMRQDIPWAVGAAKLMPNIAEPEEEQQPSTLDGQQIDQQLRSAHQVDNPTPTMGFICGRRRELAIDGVNA